MPRSLHRILLVVNCAVFDTLSLGAGHTLVVAHDGTVWAVGVNMFGQLGIDSKVYEMMSNFVEVLSGGATAVAAGGGHSM